MNLTMNCARQKNRLAFTLIEVLVVIAIMAILAAMVIPVTRAVHVAKLRSRAFGEMEQIATAIEEYKGTHGHYPPDNPLNPALNPLYYELVGTTNNGTAYLTLDGAKNVLIASLPGLLNVQGFVNVKKAGGGDEGANAKSFLKTLKPGQYADLSNGVRILVGPAKWPDNSAFNPIASDPGINPWRYNSSNPTNNPGSYDLWFDFIIGGKTNRICNWSKQMLKVGY